MAFETFRTFERVEWEPMAAEQLILVDAFDRELGVGEKMDVPSSGRAAPRLLDLRLRRPGASAHAEARGRQVPLGGLVVEHGLRPPVAGRGDARPPRVGACARRWASTASCAGRSSSSTGRSWTARSLSTSTITSSSARTTKDPAPDPSEVSEWRWVSMGELLRGLSEEPHLYSRWLKLPSKASTGAGSPRRASSVRRPTFKAGPRAPHQPTRQGEKGENRDGR